MAWALGNTTSAFLSTNSTTVVSPAYVSAAGNLIVVGVRNFNATTVTGISDTAGNAFYKINGIGNSLGTLEMWFCPVSKGNAANVVTVTFSAATQFKGLVIAEFSGGIAAPFQWSAGTATTTGSTLTTPSFDTWTPKALAIGVADINTGSTTWTAGSGFTIAVQDGAPITVLEYRVYSSVQTGAGIAISNSDGTTTKKLCGAIFTESPQGASGGGGAYAFAG